MFGQRERENDVHYCLDSKFLANPSNTSDSKDSSVIILSCVRQMFWLSSVPVKVSKWMFVSIIKTEGSERHNS